MLKKLIIAGFFCLVISGILSGQVKIRLFAGLNPGFVLLNVASGEFELDTFSGDKLTISGDALLMLSRFEDRVLLKIRNTPAIICDSLIFRGKTGNDFFTLRRPDNLAGIQKYSGELLCKSDMGTLILLNNTGIEQYIAGVVRAEGGTGKHPEYLKTQALITRTYMEKYIDKHIADGYNLCDNTHCQVFLGITDDTLIVNAALGTRGEIITGPDSLPVIAAFHSNCGGETSPSEYVWLTPQPYLVKVTDPFCLTSRNAVWEKSIPLAEWTGFLKKEGMSTFNGDPAAFSFSQKTRTTDYVTGNFRVPLRKIREDMDLRSSFFSVTVEGDSVILRGRGYGHGVGLCQEGAMAMASKGFTYKQIISFYYSGVIISRKQVY